MPIILGNENAEHDALLLDCKVNHLTIEGEKHVITGRWGTGKTAYILLLGENQSKRLKLISPIFERSWYLSESALDADQLAKANAELADPKRFARYLEQVWEAEIFRRTIVLLAAQNESLKLNGPHWDTIAKVATKASYISSLWKRVPDVIKIFRALDENQSTALRDLSTGIEDLFEFGIKDMVKAAIRDLLAKGCPQPLIAIEPIETPYSDLEGEGSLAQAVVAALLNKFQAEFQPDDQSCGPKVVISIPWHRYDSARLNLPQKIRQYEKQMSWSRIKLRTFINSRILWEFRRVRRPGTSRILDPWSELFDSEVRNEYCRPHVPEDSFSYILRHTNYRPREVQRLARMAIEECSKETQVPADDILRGNGDRVQQKFIKRAVREYTIAATTDLVTESSRRFPELRDAFQQLNGMSVPFDTDKLKRRLPDNQDLDKYLSMFWESGIIGVAVTCNRLEELQTLKELLPEGTYRLDRNIDGEEIHRWFFFEYNYLGKPNELILRFQNTDTYAANVSLVLHPRTFEALVARVEPRWPIGI